MSKVVYEDSYGIWRDGLGTAQIPVCPKCKEPTYNEDICPFCREKLEYREEN